VRSQGSVTMAHAAGRVRCCPMGEPCRGLRLRGGARRHRLHRRCRFAGCSTAISKRAWASSGGVCPPTALVAVLVVGCEGAASHAAPQRTQTRESRRLPPHPCHRVDALREPAPLPTLMPPCRCTARAGAPPHTYATVSMHCESTRPSSHWSQRRCAAGCCEAGCTATSGGTSTTGSWCPSSPTRGGAWAPRTTRSTRRRAWRSWPSSRWVVAAMVVCFSG
jgi:hypothetical protein